MFSTSLRWWGMDLEELASGDCILTQLCTYHKLQFVKCKSSDFKNSNIQTIVDVLHWVVCLCCFRDVAVVTFRTTKLDGLVWSPMSKTFVATGKPAGVSKDAHTHRTCVTVLLQWHHSLYWVKPAYGLIICFLRKWVDDLASRMTKEERDALPCYAGDSDVKMVNKYIDRSGNNRVWGT